MKLGSLIAVGVCGLALASVSATAQTSEDKHFLEKSSQGNVVEVEFAKLALTKTQNPQIRAFAKRMIHDHEKLARRMTPLIQQAGLQPSTSLNGEHQELYDKLKGMSGLEFDKEYVEDMDKDHHEDLEAFKKEEASTEVPQLKTAVASGEKVIAEHTKMIDGISRKMGMTPAGS